MIWSDTVFILGETVRKIDSENYTFPTFLSFLQVFEDSVFCRMMIEFMESLAERKPVLVLQCAAAAFHIFKWHMGL